MKEPYTKYVGKALYKASGAMIYLVKYQGWKDGLLHFLTVNAARNKIPNFDLGWMNNDEIHPGAMPKPMQDVSYHLIIKASFIKRLT